MKKCFKTIVAVCVFTALALSANASGLGQKYYLINGGNVFVKIIHNPHQDNYDWGYENSNGDEDVTVGQTEEGKVFDLGWFEVESEITFWAQGKNMRFYTGKGNGSTTDAQFVINGVKFEIYIEEGNPEMEGSSKQLTSAKVISSAGTDECVDSNVYYTKGKKVMFQMMKNTKSTVFDNSLRVVMNVDNDWETLYDGDVTVLVTLNNQCAFTYTLTDQINYFDLVSEKDYEGFRLVEYTFPVGIPYPGKLRITTEKGKDIFYIYINNVDESVFELTGGVVNFKAVIYQSGVAVQAFELEATLDKLIK